MRYLIALIFMTFVALVQAETAAPLQTTQLLGTWQVDLRPTPDAKPYFQQFVVTKVNPDNSFEGTFYGAPISQARINKDWRAIRIAFVTADQSGPYNHSAVLQGATLQGLTNSTGRNFLSYWSAIKQ